MNSLEIHPIPGANNHYGRCNHRNEGEQFDNVPRLIRGHVQIDLQNACQRIGIALRQFRNME